MNWKRNRSPSASGGESTKLCLVCEAHPLDEEIPCHYVFVLDPTEKFATDGDGFIKNREPTLRIDGLDEVTFSVFKSTLYIFETEIASPTHKFRRTVPDDFFACPDLDSSQVMKMIAELPLRKSVYSFDLSQSHSSSKMVRLQKSELLKLPDMIGAKVSANSVVTPDGKILVFSNVIICDCEVSYMPNLVAFELYNPDTRVWIKLPEIPDPKRDLNLVIVGAGFLSSFRFFISTDDGRNFVYDLDKNENCWTKYDLLPEEVLDFDLVGVVGDEGEVCLTDRDLKRTRDWTTLSTYLPLLSRFPDEVLRSRFREINGIYFALLDTADANDGCFSFCAAQSLIFRGCDTYRVSKPPFFILDVIRAHPGHRLEVSKSIKFCSQLGDIGELMLSGVFGVKF